MKHADQHLLLQFCSKMAINFLQAHFRKISKKIKKIFPQNESVRGENQTLASELTGRSLTHYAMKDLHS